MNLPYPRPSLADLPVYVAGKQVQAPADGRSFKLSSNELAYPPLPGVLEAAIAAAEQMNRYPDITCLSLYDGLARFLDVPERTLSVGVGSSAVLYDLMRVLCEPGDEIVYPWRSFEAYPIAAMVAGAVSVQVPLTVEGRHDLEAMLGAITERTKIVVLCTPNNPSGPALTHTEVMGFVEQVPSRVLVVLDEAYREFVRMPDPVDGLAVFGAFENVATCRTFSKAYGLAGLRVGYSVSSPEIAAAMRSTSLPFGLTSVAQAAALASMERVAELNERVDAVVAERERVVAALAAQGWELPEAQGNFVWFPMEDPTEFVAAAEAAGVSVRPFAGHGVRVSIGEPDANDRILEIAGALPCQPSPKRVNPSNVT